mgnify:FL=1|tara:strand:+ start:272 stop:550 length:279 start_codon:yes stop_codon:yes gene_type:complete
MKTKRELQGDIKSKGTAFLMYWFLGSHYAYLGKWGVQLAYWFTLGGLGIWLMVDLFRIGGLVKRYNNLIYEELDELEEERHNKQLEKLAALR